MLSQGVAAMFRFDLGNVQKIKLGIRSDRSFGIPSRHLLYQFVLIGGAGPMGNPSQTI
jgi:hypothetical protein